MINNIVMNTEWIANKTHLIISKNQLKAGKISIVKGN